LSPLFILLLLLHHLDTLSFPTRRSSDLPHVADDVGIGNRGVLDEQLVELRLAGDLAERAHLHGVLLHVHEEVGEALVLGRIGIGDRKSTRLNSSHGSISYAVFCLKKKKT